MALRKREIYIHQPVIPQTPIEKPVRKSSKKILTKGERFLLILSLSVIATLAIMILHTQATINATNQEIHKLETAIEETKKENTDLSIQVSELSQYDRILKKAQELGLGFNKDNVKVVPGQ